MPKKVIEQEIEEEDVSKEDYPDKDVVAEKFLEDDDDGDGVEETGEEDTSSPAAEFGDEF